MGIYIACGSGTAAIISILGGILISTFSYHYAYVVIGAICLVLLLIGSFLAVIHPAMMGLKAYGARKSKAMRMLFRQMHRSQPNSSVSLTEGLFVRRPSCSPS